MKIILMFMLLILANGSYAIFPEEVLEEMNQKRESEQEKIFQDNNNKYRLWLLNPQSIRNTTSFVMLFKRNHENKIARLLYSKFSDRGQKLLGEYREDSEPSSTLFRRTIFELNQIIMGPIIYEQDIFQDIEENFSQETKTLVKWYLDAREKSLDIPTVTEATVQINRFLIEDSFPNDIFPLRRNIRENSLLSQAVPAGTNVEESNSEQEEKRFFEMYEGKTFHTPAHYSEQQTVVEDPTKLTIKKETPSPKEEKSTITKVILWALFILVIGALLYQIKTSKS